MPALQAILDVDASGKAILVRADRKVPLYDNKFSGRTRLEQFNSTGKTLKFHGAKVAILCHLGHPNAPDRSLSLRIAEAAKAAICEITPPADDVAAESYAAHAPHATVANKVIPSTSMILDAGTATKVFYFPTTDVTFLQRLEGEGLPGISILSTRNELRNGS